MSYHFRTYLPFIAILFLLTKRSDAQVVFNLDSSIIVTENGFALPKAWVGGLDCPMYSTIDLNKDGFKDLFIFDHKNNLCITSFRQQKEYCNKK